MLRRFLASRPRAVKIIQRPDSRPGAPMPLQDVPYEALRPLIRDHLSRKEDDATAALMRRLRPAKARGYLTAAELELVCYWKAARAIGYIRSNTPTQVKTVTRAALSTRSEHKRLDALTSLRGVSIPMALAILMLLSPRRYGVIDIRVWQLLHRIGAVRKNAAGVAFSFGNWYQFLMIIRHFAREFNVPARDIERTLFEVHRKYQAGRLYDAISPRKVTV